MSLSPSDGQKLVEFLKFLQENSDLMEGYNPTVPVEGYLLLGCLVVLVFDYIITLDQEVNYVWSSPWSLGLPLFYINRYVPFIDIGLFIHFQFNHMDQQACHAQVQAATWTILFPSFFGQMIIVLRTCALWQNDMSIIVILTLMMLSSLLVTSVFTAKQLKTMVFAPTPSFIRGCLSFDKSNITLYIYVALFVSEFVIISLTLVKAYQHLRRNHTAWISQLYKNGILYCLIILAFSLFNIIIPTTSLPYAYKQSLRMPQHVFHSMFCNRVVFQLFKHRLHYHRARSRRRTLNAGHSQAHFPDEGYASDYDYPTDTNNIFTSVVLDGELTTTATMTGLKADDDDLTMDPTAHRGRLDIELDILETRRSDMANLQANAAGQVKTQQGRRESEDVEPSWII